VGDRGWQAPLFVLALAAILYLAGNGSTSLWDRDEPQYVEAAREMAASRHFVAPTLFGEPFLDKPPAVYWLIDLGAALFGWTEFAARLFPALTGAAAAAVTAALGSRLFDPRVGLVAGCLLATSPQMAVVAKAAATDAPLVFFVTLAFYGFVRLEAGSRSLASFAGFYGGVALATLTKGLPGPLIVALTVLVWVIRIRDAGTLRRLQPLAGIIAFTVIVGAWVAAAIGEAGRDVVRVGLLRETVARAGEPFEGHAGSVLYYPAFLVPGFFPWSCFLPAAFAGIVWTEKRSSLLVAWAAVTFAVFTLASTKLPHYVLPAYPPLSLLVARFFCETIAGRRTIGRASLALLLVVSVCSAAALVGVASWFEFRAMLPWTIVTAAALVATGVAGAVFFARRLPRSGLAALTSGTAVTLLFAGAVLAPGLEQYKISRPIAEEVLSRARPGERIAVFRYREPSLRFYLGGRVVELRSKDDLAAFLQDPRRGWIVMPCEELRDAGPLAIVHSERGFNPAKGRWIELCVAASGVS
jgi:4-amino-4-deoxy-L-arabinose transferase-like glycosyltransferase